MGYKIVDHRPWKEKTNERRQSMLNNHPRTTSHVTRGPRVDFSELASQMSIKTWTPCWTCFDKWKVIKKVLTLLSPKQKLNLTADVTDRVVS